MILAGDIGGTKTALALYKADAGQNTGLGRPVREQTFASGDFPSLEAILRAFLRTDADRPRRATFAVAGPVIGTRVKTTNLPWTIRGDELSQTFNIDSVHLINDLQAVAADVPHLAADEIHTLNAGEPHVHGAIAVVAPGTGLGEAFAVWTGSRYLSCPTEGGHASFGPNSHEELELLVFLERRFGHVSYERVCSGSGIQNLYDFLCDTGRYAEPDWLGRALKQVTDRTPVIVNAALEDRAEICSATLTLFVRILGGTVGNMALKVFASGGVYLAGGMPPRILPRLQQPDFLAAMCRKGRFSDMLTRVPVHIILDAKTAALRGAAWYALEQERT